MTKPTVNLRRNKLVPTEQGYFVIQPRRKKKIRQFITTDWVTKASFEVEWLGDHWAFHALTNLPEEQLRQAELRIRSRLVS